MSFLLSFIGGALFSGSIVALKQPRSGKANQRRVKSYLNNVKMEANDFSSSLNEVKNSATHLMDEISAIQTEVVPSVAKTIEDFQLHSDVHTRRIQDDLKRINREADEMNK